MITFVKYMIFAGREHMRRVIKLELSKFSCFVECQIYYSWSSYFEGGSLMEKLKAG